MPHLHQIVGMLFVAVLSLILGNHRSLAALSFAPGISIGTVQNNSINEASGIAASRANANVLWTHNDSGDSARVFAMTSAGTNLGTYSISGAGATDWEDIAVGLGPLAGQQYLYIADIGDNGASRSSVSVYRVPEPVVSDTQSPITTSISGAAKFTFVYPNGPRDAESLFVDPLTNDIYIVSKPLNTKYLYRAAYPQSTSGATTLELMTSFSDSSALTAADISPDGNEIIVRSYATTSGRLYQRPAGGSIADAFATAPIMIPLLSEPQGEAIAFDPNGWGYYTTSEGSQEPINYFNRLPAPAGTMYWDNDANAAGSYVATGTGFGGSGTWNTSSRKWYTGGAEVAWVGGNDAVFWGTAGTVTLAAGQSVNSLTFKTSGYLLTASTITLVGSSIAVDSGVAATIGSTAAGSAGLAKNGGGTLTLTHANTYTGGTVINGGTLVVTNTTGSGTGTGPVDVHAGAKLGGTGTIVGEVSNSGTLAPGMSAGMLHINGDYNQAADGRLEIELASTSSFDELAVTGTASLAGTLAVSLTGGFLPQAGDAFAFITASGFGSTTFGNTILPVLAGGLGWKVDYGANSVSLFVTLPGDFTGDGAVDGADYVVWREGLGTTFTQTDYDVWRAHFGQSVGAGGSLGAAAVPEPAGLTLIGLTIGLLMSVRRNSR